MKQFWLDTSKMTDGELADLIHELRDELADRCGRINTGNWLNDQLDAAQLKVRSWSTSEQRAMGAARDGSPSPLDKQPRTMP